MRFDALHKRVTYLFASLGFAALMLGDDLGLVARLLVVAFAVGSWYFEGPRVYSERTTIVLTTVAIGAFALQVARFFVFEVDGVTLAVEYAALLQLTRLFHRRTATEYLHVVGLGFLHLLAGTVLSSGLDYGAVFAGFLVVTPWMLTLTHLRGELERQHATESELAHPPTERLARALASQRLASRGFLLGSSLLSLPLFLVTAGFFLLFPRVGLGMFTFGQDRGEAVAGFGDTIDLGRFGTIRDDPTVVARVFPLPGSSPPSAHASLRLRGTSFDRYDGRRWTRSHGRIERHDGSLGMIRLDRSRASRPLLQPMRLIVEPVHDGVIFVPEDGVALDLPPRIESGRSVYRSVLLRDGADARLVDDDGVALDYVVLVDRGGVPSPRRLDDEERARLLELPPGMEPIGEIARSLVTAMGGSAAKSDREVATRFERYLRDEGRYRYSLTAEDPGAQNALVHFVRDGRSGHCELFASALVVMLRSVGIPSRNVAGYLGGTFNEFGGYYAVRSGDAHSWVEAYVDGRFLTFDPTPASREETRPVDGFASTVRAWFDALRTRWSRDVVGYDMRRQLEIALRLRDYFRSRRDADGSASLPVDDEGAPGVPARSRTVGLGLLAVLVLAVVVVVAALRDTTEKERSIERSEAEKLYLALESVLVLAGQARPPSRTPEEHARALLEAQSELADLTRSVTDAYARVRYADQSLTAGEFQRLADRVERARAAFAARVRHR